MNAIDLQGANILLQEALTHPGVVPAIKVSDFGLARSDGPWDAETANALKMRGRCVSMQTTTCINCIILDNAEAHACQGPHFGLSSCQADVSESCMQDLELKVFQQSSS